MILISYSAISTSLVADFDDLFATVKFLLQGMPDSVFITTYQPRRSEIQPWNSSYFMNFEKWIVMAKFCNLSCELIP
jgi:hypothetical protein